MEKATGGMKAEKPCGGKTAWKYALAAAAVAVPVVLWFVLAPSADDAETVEGTAPAAETPAAAPTRNTVRPSRLRPVESEPAAMPAFEPEPADVGGEEKAPKTDEERREEAEEAAVEAFDALTDKWMEPSAKGVTMTEVAAFGEAFRKVPQSRRDECIHRALNLIPDENVMLLVGVLMDKTQDKEIVETVYNDVLNRDESVKKPILQEIYRDKSHPCWADTAWILDVTGEIPKKSAENQP